MKPELKLILLTTLLFFYANTALAQVYVPGKEPKPALNEPVANETKFPAADAFANSKIEYKIISAANNTFGYEILADNKLLIHQPSIPAMAGNEGFKSREAAENIAKLVIAKIKRGEMPPTVSIEEMKKLKAIK